MTLLQLLTLFKIELFGPPQAWGGGEGGGERGGVQKDPTLKSVTHILQ